MVAYGQRTSRRSVDPEAVLNYWAERVEHLLRACVRDRAGIPGEQSIDVLFHEFMADDLGMVEQIYARAGLEMTATARGELTRFIADHPRGKHGQVVYDLRQDFGVDPVHLRERFGFYFEEFPVRVEVK
jgi:hypothetical protein